MNKGRTIEDFNEYAKRESAMFQIDDLPDIDKLRVMFICDEFMNITTYDDSVSLRLGGKIIEIMKVILERKNFEYIKDEDNYDWFIMITNMFDQLRLIEWGSSIRGCWFEELEYFEWLIYQFIGLEPSE
jgi:hypothetical protein